MFLRQDTRLPPYKRQVNTVPEYAVPALNVFENVASGLRLQEAGRKEIRPAWRCWSWWV